VKTIILMEFHHGAPRKTLVAGPYRLADVQGLGSIKWDSQQQRKGDQRMTIHQKKDLAKVSM
jgi:hypothetical protein